MVQAGIARATHGFVGGLLAFAAACAMGAGVALYAAFRLSGDSGPAANLANGLSVLGVGYIAWLAWTVLQPLLRRHWIALGLVGLAAWAMIGPGL